jgi:DNA-binding MarR family transcriptional regulator
LLIATRGHIGQQPPTIRELAVALQLRHHTVVELIDRAAENGLVERVPSSEDQRRVGILITPQGESVLESLSVAHRSELRQLESVLRRLTKRFGESAARDDR